MDRLQNLWADIAGGEKIGFLDPSQSSLYLSAAAIAINPIFWNIIARQEYNTHFLTKIFRSPYYGCYALAVVIFGMGIFRDYLYKSALADQPRYPPVHQPLLAYGLIMSGNVLVISSMWALGVTGTYLGDYFGILMDKKVEGFPFNLTSAPMYWGSTMNFLGYALLTGKIAGLILTAEVFAMYLGALQFEEYGELNSGMKDTDSEQPIHRGYLCEEGQPTTDEVDDEENSKEEGLDRLHSSTGVLRELQIPGQINFAMRFYVG